ELAAARSTHNTDRRHLTGHHARKINGGQIQERDSVNNNDLLVESAEKERQAVSERRVALVDLGGGELLGQVGRRAVAVDVVGREAGGSGGDEREDHERELRTTPPRVAIQSVRPVRATAVTSSLGRPARRTQAPPSARAGPI